LASLNTARSKGNDAAIQSDLTGIRTQAAIYYADHNNYGPTEVAVVSDCTTGGSNVFSDATIQNQIAGALKANNNGDIVCNVSADGKAFAASAVLSSVSTSYFCVDSTGMGTTTTTALGTNTSC
ncbi:MAG: hypothetical protein WCV89_03405, partial [Candidatus Paceibacterota bacterium]